MSSRRSTKTRILPDPLSSYINYYTKKAIETRLYKPSYIKANSTPKYYRKGYRNSNYKATK